ncbi:MAG: acyltransferase family protein [Selenomonadaceae bacterium]|nr:acyltransferase family protein [Selenomonadaceae bacterium]
MQKNRLFYIDFLKAVCAFLICLFHFQIQFMNDGYIGWHCQPEAAANPYLAYFNAFPYSLTVNTSFRLPLFFAIVGFLPALFLFRDSNVNHLYKEARIRYFRFFPLIFISCVISFSLIKCGLIDFHSYFLATGNEWFRAREDFDYNFFTLIKEIFFYSYIRGTQFVSPLWCMGYIFIGSYLVYAFLLMFGLLRRRWPFYVAVAVFAILYDSWYLSFILGIIAADFSVNHAPLNTAKGIFLVLLGISISLFPQVLLPEFIDINILTASGAFLILIGMHSNLQNPKIYKSKFIEWCSRESFSLIVIQNLVQFSLNTILYLYFNKMGMDVSLNIALQFIINILATALITHIYSGTITPLTQRICNFADSHLR